MPIANLQAARSNFDGAPLPQARTCEGPPNLALLPDVPLQWWFVQGMLDGPGDLQRHFMIALFRTLAAPDAAPAYMLLQRLINCRGGQAESRSRITPGVREVVRDIALRLTAAHLPVPLARLLVGLHMDQTEASAQRDGVEIAAGPQVGSGGLALTWDGVALAQHGNEIHLRFPVNADTAELILTPERPWLDEHAESLTTGLAARYEYQCCPRLAISGHLGGMGVSGRAWLDHQWGPIDGWLLTQTDDAGLQPLGWDWFGLSFNSGEELMVMRHFLPGDPKRGDSYALLFNRTGAVQVGLELKAQTLKTWHSRRTGITYPVQQRLWLPALDGEIEVVPLAEDQEIPVFGLPAIWQGAVAANGRIGSRLLSGTGRLELFGYGYAPSIQAYLMRAVRRRFPRLFYA